MWRQRCDVRVGRGWDFINKDHGGRSTLCLPEVRPSHPVRWPKVFPTPGSGREKRGCALPELFRRARQVARSLAPRENSVADCSVYSVSSSTPMNKQSVVEPVGAENIAFPLSSRAALRQARNEIRGNTAGYKLTSIVEYFRIIEAN